MEGKKNDFYLFRDGIYTIIFWIFNDTMIINEIKNNSNVINHLTNLIMLMEVYIRCWECVCVMYVACCWG